MSYYDIFRAYREFPSEKRFADISPSDAENAIRMDAGGEERLLALLSPAAGQRLEEAAQSAHALTIRHFGRTVKLYTPMYVSNYCENQCAYCGFNSAHGISRRRLNPGEVEREAVFIARTGLRHILVLTGDSREKSSPGYIKECVGIIGRYFDSVSLEIYALTAGEYAEMVSAGADGLSLYQETYDETRYGQVHRAGPKTDYCFRLDAPERAAESGFRNVSIGVLLGLHDWRRDIFFTALHAKYLQDKFPDVEIGVSLPRLRPFDGSPGEPCAVSDSALAQIVIALRLFLPRLAINLSTRERPALREGLLPLGITCMSAGSSTRVGGHTLEAQGENAAQFDISDERDVAQIKSMLSAKGYQPVMKDWMRI